MTLHDLDSFLRSHRRQAQKKRNGGSKSEANGRAQSRPFGKWSPPANSPWSAFGAGAIAFAQNIDDLIKSGMSENDVTDETYFQRNPALRGQTLKANSPEARAWVAIRDNEVRPAVKRTLGAWKVDPARLAMFLSQYESDSRVPADITEQFLTRSPLLSLGKSLRDMVVLRWHVGKEPPLTLDQLYTLAYQLSGHQGTAFLLCHNVTKAFSRGGTAITWDRVGSAPDSYTDGTKTWTPKVTHARGKLTTKHSEKHKRELPSIFYLLFSDAELGTSDPGDWYHYYVTATMAAFGAGNELIGTSAARARSLTKRIMNKIYEELVQGRIGDLERGMSDARFAGSGAYRGFVLANAVSFLEGGFYGADQAEVGRESRFHMRGARAGLAAHGARPGKGWLWYVPKAQSLAQEDLVTGFSLKDKTAETLDAAS
jgi:hypothetical protein